MELTVTFLISAFFYRLLFYLLVPQLEIAVKAASVTFVVVA